MRVMVIVKATKSSETGELPSEALLDAMSQYNEALVEAGVMVAGEGLQPSSAGKRVAFSGSQRTVLDGPFAETKELVAGFWIWQVESMEHALQWVKLCPDPMPGEAAVLELRPVYETADFGDAMTPETRERDERLRAQLAARG